MPLQLRVILFFLFVAIQVYGQQPSLQFNHINAADGLPYSLVVKMHKAANNVVWISTWGGLYYFDGKKVKKFALPDSNKNFFGGWTNYIIEGKQNDIYVGSVKGLMAINSLTQAATILPLYKENNLFTPYYTEPLFVDGSNNLWLFTGYNQASLYKLCLKDKVLQFVIKDINGVLSVIKDKLKQSPAGMWYRENKGAYYVSFNNDGAKMGSSFLLGKRKGEPMLYVNAVVARDTTEAWFATGQGLFYANRITDKIKQCNLGPARQPNNVKSLAQSKNGLLYCATGTNGILVYDPVTDKVVASYRHYDQDLWSISGNNIEYIYIDDSEHLFAAIANQGISYASLTDTVQTYYKLMTPQKEPAFSFNDRITVVALKNNFGYYYVQEKGLFICNKQMIVQKIIPDKYTGKINHLLSGNGDTVWAAADKGLFYFLNSTAYSVPMNIINHTPRLYNVTSLSGNRVAAAGEEGIYFCEKKNERLSLKKFDIKPKIEYPFFTSIFQYGDGELILNTKSTSFYKAAVEGNTIKLSTETHAIDVVPLAYQKISDSGILIGCTDGIYLYNTNSALLQMKTPEKGMANSAFLFDKDKVFTLSENDITTYLIGDNLVVLDMQPIALGSYSPLYKTGSLEGISGTSGGLVRLNLEKRAEPYYYVFNGSNTANNIWHPLTANADSLVLELNDEKKFYVSTNNFSGSPAVIYFKDGVSREWQEFANGEMVSIEHLSGGWHTLSFNVFPLDKGSIHKTVFIPTPWYKKWWSRSAGLLVLFMLLTLVVKKIINNEKRKANIKNYIVETEMAALKAQMNPHFMFNCINSIDAFIQTNDKYNATLYLNKFAKLIRNVLDSSKENIVPFSKDIETLKLYIQLEELRSENKFKTQLDIDEELMSSDYKVPPLIIQPFVENAILHGLRNKETNDGILSVHISKTEKHIVYSITDNGIGRVASQKINTGKGKSYGMEMSYDRVKLFNNEKEASVIFTDLYDGKMPTGTKVQVNLKIV